MDILMLGVSLYAVKEAICMLGISVAAVFDRRFPPPPPFPPPRKSEKSLHDLREEREEVTGELEDVKAEAVALERKRDLLGERMKEKEREGSEREVKRLEWQMEDLERKRGKAELEASEANRLKGLVAREIASRGKRGESPEGGK